ncbi:MAG: hypothetical protein ACOZEN_09155 [Thermodesulfobacteriota bacterium]|jgi:hypothetical protein
MGWLALGGQRGRTVPPEKLAGARDGDHDAAGWLWPWLVALACPGLSGALSRTEVALFGGGKPCPARPPS